MRYRYGESVYRIAVLNSRDASDGPRVTVDGVEQQDQAITLADDGREHSVEMRMRPPRATEKDQASAPVPATSEIAEKLN